MGFGLCICKALVSQNGGAIKVHSEGLGKGTTFEFYFVLDEYVEGHTEASHPIKKLLIEPPPLVDHSNSIMNMTIVESELDHSPIDRNISSMNLLQTTYCSFLNLRQAEQPKNYPSKPRL